MGWSDRLTEFPLIMSEMAFVTKFAAFSSTTTDDDAYVERQVSPDGGDDVDHVDDSHDIAQPNSEDIA
jgi:hypothetical protein